MGNSEKKSRSFLKMYPNYPYITSDVMVIYTLKEYAYNNLQNFNIANDFQTLVLDPIKQITDFIDGRLENIRSLAQKQTLELCSLLKINTSNADEAGTALLQLLNERCNMVEAGIEEEMKKKFHEVEQFATSTSEGYEAKRKVAKGNDMSIGRLKLTKIDFSSLTTDFKNLDEKKYKQISQLIIKNLTQQIATRLKNRKIIKEIKPEEFKNLKKIFGVEELKDIITDSINAEEKENQDSYQNISDRINSSVEHKFKSFLKDQSKKIFDSYFQELRKMINAAENMPNLNIKNVEYLKKLLHDEETNRHAAIVSLGYLYEQVEVLKLSTKQLHNPDGSLASVEQIPAQENPKDITDVRVTFTDGKRKIFGNVSVKSFEIAHTNTVNPRYLNNSLNEILFSAIRSAPPGKDYFTWMMVNNFAVMLNRPEEDFNDIKNIVGRIRYEYGRLAAIAFTVGHIFAKDQEQIKKEKLESYLSDPNLFPIFYAAPGGTIFTVDVLDDLIGSTKKGQLYQNDAPLKANLLADENFRRLTELKDLGYSYPKLCRYLANPRTYITSIYNRGMKRKGQKEQRYERPYEPEDLAKALNVMSTVSKFILSGNSFQKIMDILLSNIALYGTNTAKQIYLNKK